MCAEMGLRNPRERTLSGSLGPMEGGGWGGGGELKCLFPGGAALALPELLGVDSWHPLPAAGSLNRLSRHLQLGTWYNELLLLKITQIA